MVRYFLFVLVLLMPFPLVAQTQEKGEYLIIDGGKIYYERHGTGDPVIVVHGGPGLDHHYLLPQMMRLSSSNEVIFYDQRGTGKSSIDEVSELTINFNQFVTDIENLRLKLGHKKVALLGHSFGGLLAMQYAILYPEYVSALILADSAPATSVGWKMFADEWSKRTASIKGDLEKIQKSKSFEMGDKKAIYDFYHKIFSVYFYKKSDIKKLTLEFDSPDASSRGIKIMHIFGAMMHDYNFVPELKDLKVPTLIIHGDHDIVPLSTAQEIHASIKNSEIHIVKYCGHFPYIEKQKEFFRVIKEFLTRKFRSAI